LSLQFNVPIIELKKKSIQPEAVSLIPEELARKACLIPMRLLMMS